MLMPWEELGPVKIVDLAKNISQIDQQDQRKKYKRLLPTAEKFEELFGVSLELSSYRQITNSAPDVETRKMLVIAELNSLGKSLSIVLTREDFDVTVLDTFKQVGEVFGELYGKLSRNNYDMVILTDNGLKPDNILTFIPRIRRKQWNIKIVVLSGWSTPEFVSDLMALGIDGFLPLPFNAAELVHTVSSMLMKREKL